MTNAIINITTTFVSLKEECDEGGICFFSFTVFAYKVN